MVEEARINSGGVTQAGAFSRALKGRLGAMRVLKDASFASALQGARWPSRRFSARETRDLCRAPIHRVPAILAAVPAPIFLREPAGFGARPKDLGPPAVLEHGHIAARQELERAPHPFQVIELCGSALVKSLEPRWVHEITHGESIERELDLFHGIG